MPDASMPLTSTVIFRRRGCQGNQRNRTDWIATIDRSLRGSVDGVVVPNPAGRPESGNSDTSQFSKLPDVPGCEANGPESARATPAGELGIILIYVMATAYRGRVSTCPPRSRPTTIACVPPRWPG